jgi:YegS/Rv2252/BmrU family lipid kinase
MANRALLIVNRRSRQGENCANAAAAALRDLGIELLEGHPTKKETLSDLVARHQAEVDLAILGGGDGTLNAAVDGLVRARLPVGILPLGTANDLARTLGLPNDLIEACRVIAAGHTRRIDLGQVNDKCFFNVASIGLSVDITSNLTKEVKKVWGVLAYLKTALRMTYRARPFWAEIHADGQALRVRTVQIAIGNGRHYGGGMTVCEEAAIDDQLLDLYSLEIRHWWQVVWLLPRLKSGALSPSKHVRTLRGKAFEVVTPRMRHVNTDGEITSRTPALFRVIPQALTVFVPADCQLQV